MDKDSLKKYQFWYLLGGAGLLTLIVLVCAAFAMAGGAEEQKKYEGALKGVQGAKSPKNASFLPPWQAHKKIFTDQKEGIWRKAWDTQKDLYDWPEGDTTVVEFNKRMAYPAEVKQLSAAERREYKQIYAKQFNSDELQKSVAPAVFLGGNSGFEAIMGPTMAGAGTAGRPGFADRGGFPERGGIPPQPGVGGPGGAGAPEGVGFNVVIKDAGKDDPLPEEIWILQEDYWVKKEMLHIIQEVQQRAARFKRVDEKDAPKEGLRYRNGDWEIKLIVEGNTISNMSTITNVSAAKAPLPLGGKESKALRFQLRQGAGAPLVLQIAGEPLVPETALEFKNADPKEWEKPKVIDERLDLSKPFDLEMVFEWSNAPIRRIDALRTAKQSHRTAKCSLVPYPAFKSAESPDAGGAARPAAAAGGQPAAQGAGAPAAVDKPGVGPGGPGGLGGVQGAATEVYGLEKNRYIIATEQSRHLPIAMVLVVEENHINDVLIAIASSPLRIQATQIAFHEMPLRGPASTTGDPSSDRPRGVVPDQPIPPRRGPGDGGPVIRPGGPGVRPGDPRPGDPRPGGPRPGGPMPGGPMPGGPGSHPEVQAEDYDTNLVELTVYGIATLYERYKEKTADTPQSPGAPPPGAPGTKPGPALQPGKP
jgi:hypothetical protein